MPRQTRKKKGGKQLELSEMDNDKVEALDNENKNNDKTLNKSLEGGMDNVLDTDLKNDLEEGKKKEGGSNIQMSVNESTTNNATSMLSSMGNMFKNAVTGLTTTGGSNKVGGSNNLQSKLFTSLKARSNKLNENLVELDSLQKNLNAKTNSVKLDVEGLENQFKLYNKMGGGKKSRKKHKKHKKHKKTKRRSHNRRKTKHRRRTRKH